jgi:hypothetical protein
MLVTTTEASTKYCPFKFASTLEPKTCWNVRCMAWKKDREVPTTHDEMGYCGLAGNPSRIENMRP